jgi:cytochrome d ubiquinol oxidase subunit II
MLAELPVIVALAGLAAYVVLAGADFGAGIWHMLPAGRRAAAVREHTHRSMSAVWEANHVWLIFVLVICWTAYPVAFGSIASTLAVPLLIAALGIIVRGIAYAMRSATEPGREELLVGGVFALSSLLTPFALGAAIGGVASGRVPVGNAAGDLWSSWLNPTSVLVGTLAVATAAYLAAVYLAADASRLGERDLADAFRLRALGTGVLAGAVALGGLGVLAADAQPLFDDLVGGAGLPALLASVTAGTATLALVSARHYEPARYSAALAVVAIIAGWALAQQPTFLPGLTIDEAAAGDATLVATLVGIAVGLAIVLPSLYILFGLVLRGRFDPTAARVADVAPATRAGVQAPRGIGRATVALLLAGVALTLFGGGLASAVGAVALLVFCALGAIALLQPDALDGAPPSHARDPGRRGAVGPR